MSRDPRPHNVGMGRHRAASRGGGLLTPKVDEVLADFGRLNTEDARAAFADKWVRLTADQMDRTWTVFYELLRIIRDRKLYENAPYMEDRTPRSSFEDYWEHVVRKPFDTWLELEATHHFVTTSAPGLAAVTLGEASAARARAVQEAESTKPLNPHGVRSQDRCTDYIITSAPSAKGTSPEYLTARIARDHPEVLERMKAGEFKSVRQAALSVGIVQPTVVIPADPTKAGRRLARHFTPDQFDALIVAYRQAIGDRAADTLTED